MENRRIASTTRVQTLLQRREEEVLELRKKVELLQGDIAAKDGECDKLRLELSNVGSSKTFLTSELHIAEQKLAVVIWDLESAEKALVDARHQIIDLERSVGISNAEFLGKLCAAIDLRLHRGYTFREAFELEGEKICGQTFVGEFKHLCGSVLFKEEDSNSSEPTAVAEPQQKESGS